MHGSRSGAEDSRGDAQSIEVGEQISGTQYTTSNINIVTCHMAADVNAT